MRSLFPLLVYALSLLLLPAQTPEQVAMTYFEKLKSGGINSVGSLMHPHELKKFQEMMTPIVEGALTTGNAREQEAFASFADPKDPKKLQAMDPEKFMNHFMGWVEKMQPGMTAVLKDATIETLGHVVEKELKHVVVRMKMKAQGVEIEKMSVLSFKDHQGVPKMTLTGEMKGMAESLKRRR